MSEYVRNKGIIKRLSTPETTEEVFKKLVADGEINEKYCEFYNDKLGYIDSEKYEVINDCIFDVSGAPDEYDAEEDVNEAEKLNDTDYRVHAYYYNGGASFGEMLEESIPKADLDYAPKTSKEIIKEALAKAHVDELEAMLIITEIFEELK